MRIIENNFKYKQETPTEEYICEECNSVFEYEDEDICVDDDNIEFVKCPCCGHKCITYTPPTIETIKFPKNFYQFGICERAINISDSEITNDIRECIKWLEKYPEEPFRYIGKGNIFLCVFNHEDEYYIMVAKNYFETSIDK